MSDTGTFQFHVPTPVDFGPGVASKTGERVKGLGLRHILLVTDPFIAASAACELVRSSLEQAGVAVSLYREVELDPDAASISRAAAAYGASDAEGIVALGGGSAIDTAKAMGVLAAAGTAEIEPFFFGGPQRAPAIPPLICVPTTAGTGSEVTWVAVVTQGMQKRVVRDRHLAPTLALVDPELTVSMPVGLTVSTGLDALSHALETMTARMTNPISDGLALDALVRIFRWLPRAVEQGSDLQARTELCLAATTAGMAFINGRLHLGHAVGHSMGTHFKLAHGAACAMCLPAILRFLEPVIAEQLARIGVALGVADVPAALAELMARVGALRLGVATGVRQNELGRLVEIVQSEERLIGLSRRVPGAEEWRAIFEQSW